VDALVAAGVRRERLVVASRGSADPLATPAQSRRVEIKAE
jgi:outer membrane protein OmpA-like peptidoglycan-associated protein